MHVYVGEPGHQQTAAAVQLPAGRKSFFQFSRRAHTFDSRPFGGHRVIGQDAILVIIAKDDDVADQYPHGKNLDSKFKISEVQDL